MSNRTVCPFCRSFLSLEPYIQMRSDYVFCRSCGESVHVPSYYLGSPLCSLCCDAPAVHFSSLKKTDGSLLYQLCCSCYSLNSLPPVSPVIVLDAAISRRSKRPFIAPVPSPQLDLFGGVA